MRVAVIAPVPLLPKYATTGYHLVLAHMLHENKRYREFYEEASAAGDFIILDNSAHEMGIGQPVDVIMSSASHIEPSEVVLPDRLFFAEDTVKLSTAAYPTFRESLPQVRVMGVPQGRAPKEFDWCCRKLLELGVDTIGLSKDYEVWKGGLVARVNVIRSLAASLDRDIEIHLLGWGRELGELAELSAMQTHVHAPIRGVDSAKPLVFTSADIRLPPAETLNGDGPAYPGRPSNFFELQSLDEELAFHNLGVFEQLANWSS